MKWVSSLRIMNVVFLKISGLIRILKWEQNKSSSEAKQYKKQAYDDKCLLECLKN